MSVQTQAAQLTPPAKQTYGQILKSSALIGGSSVLNIGFSVIRTKAMAVLLGPAGYGLMGLYSSVSELVRSFAGMGLNNSGVRQIAEAVGSQDDQRIAETVTTLRRVALVTGALGGLLLLVLCQPISFLTFGDTGHAGAIALLGLAVFFGDVSAGQVALVQGMRRIADLARITLLGGFFGTALSIPIVYLFFRQGRGEQGVVPALIAVAATGILTSWWYARKINVPRVTMTLRQIYDQSSALLRLGFVFMITGLMNLGVLYLARIILVHKIDLEAAGFYQAAWTLGGVYFGFILQAMGADFYPRLTAVARDNAECNRLVNEQAEVGLLLGAPGVLGTLTFAPLIIALFYSSRFGPAVDVLRWICLGMVLRVASWPMGFILLAKGEGSLFFWTELLGSTLQAGLIWIGVRYRGLEGAGMAFFALYVFYGLVIYFVVRRVSGFRWSSANQRLAVCFAPLVALVFVSWYLLPHLWAAILGVIVTCLSGIYSLKLLCRLVPFNKLPRPVSGVLRLLRLTGPAREG
jgi:enterobacterial common antigen flippase